LFGDFIFKLEEEVNTALLLHLLKVFAENCFFGSASGLGCRVVVAIAQAVHSLANCWNKIQIRR
jgi:hypothetical protein